MKTSYRRISILTCVIAADLWSILQMVVEEILKVNSSFEGNDRERNRRINAAYAKLWLADHRFQWAGLAAFASKQVGCGLLHSAEVSEKNRRVREQVGRAIAAYPGADASTMVQSSTEAAAQYMYRKLGFGNAHLFLDIYPLHRFFMERGGRSSIPISPSGRTISIRCIGRWTGTRFGSGRRLPRLSMDLDASIRET